MHKIRASHYRPIYQLLCPSFPESLSIEFSCFNLKMTQLIIRKDLQLGGTVLVTLLASIEVVLIASLLNHGRTRIYDRPNGTDYRGLFFLQSQLRFSITTSQTLSISTTKVQILLCI